MTLEHVVNVGAQECTKSHDGNANLLNANLVIKKSGFNAGMLAAITGGFFAAGSAGLVFGPAKMLTGAGAALLYAFCRMQMAAWEAAD